MKHSWLLVAGLLSSCANISHKAPIIQHLELKPELKSTSKLEIDLFLSNQGLPRDIIPSDLSKAIIDSLRWKFYQYHRLPNACYLIKQAATEDQPANVRYGFAILDVCRNKVSGDLLLWPDAGLEIELRLSSGNYATGKAEWWSSFTSRIFDENGNNILADPAPMYAILKGPVRNGESMNNCFKLIRDAKGQVSR